MSKQTVYREELAELMRELLASRSQRQLARDAEVSPATIGNMLLGRAPSREICVAVARAARIDESRVLAASGYEIEKPSTPVEAYRYFLRTLPGMPEPNKEEIEKEVARIREKYKKKTE